MLVQNYKTLEYIPWIANSMPDVSDDNLTYIFEIREEVYFSDGYKLTGEDLIFSLKALKNPFTDAAPLRNYYKDVISAFVISSIGYSIAVIYCIVECCRKKYTLNVN